MAKGRIWRAIVAVGLLLLIVLYVHSCLPKAISDLRVVKVERIPASAWPESDDLREALMRRGEMAWRISLSGNANWIREVRRHELNSYANVVRCDDRNQGVDSFGPFVGPARVTSYEEALAQIRPSSTTLQYDIYLPETSHFRSQEDFNAPMPTYDLSRERLSLCIRIAGGAMHGAYNRSNEVKILVGMSR